MHRLPFRPARAVLAALLLAAAAPLLAQEAAIRKALVERFPRLPAIDEVRPTPVPGLFEVRFGGTEILYSDEKGEYIIDGALIETRSRTNLTEQRIEKLTAIDFARLPIKDAITIRQGNGARKLAVFVDPNCGYCKHFERDLSSLKDVTIYNFLIPILGPDSNAKSRDIWCAKDPAKAWRAWMIEGRAAPTASDKCDSGAIDRNMAFRARHKINGTPAVVFEDGTRRPGAMPLEAVERALVAAARKS